MGSACLTCGHDKAAHAATKTHWCRHSGCICTEFERTGPATASTSTGAVARPADRHRFRPVLGELEDLCHCATCGLPRDHVTHDPPVAGPPDLAHAIQAAAKALAGRLFGTPEQLERYAGVAVEAAAPVLLQATRKERAELAVLRHSNDLMRDLTREQDLALQATRDRLADLEVYAADLHELLARTTQLQTADRHGECSFCGMAPDHAHCWWCGSRQAEAANPQHTADCLFAAALQVDPPARGRAILDEVERLRVYHRALALQVLAYRRAALDTPAERNALQGLLEIVEGFKETALGLAAAREEGDG